MERFLNNPYFLTLSYVTVSGLSLIFFLAIFEWVTRYKAWEEIQRGNLAVAFAVGGKILGIANIFRYSILHHDSVYSGLLWGFYGFLLLLAAYFIFEFLTPAFRVDRELEKGNLAVGFLSFIISLGVSYVIGASIVVR